MASLLDQVKFDDKGLVAVVVQDARTNEVLMFAWMNREALEKTVSEKRAWYWSRSRNKLWLKGETSGHTQAVQEICIDCDGDCVLIRVEQKGGACHTGYRTCFYRSVDDEGAWQEKGEKVFAAEEVYGR